MYTKLRCHLCEEAYRLLIGVAYDIPLEIDVVDISHEHNQEIEPLYAHRIPVVTSPEAQTELVWPFTTEDIRAYLEA